MSEAPAKPQVGLVRRVLTNAGMLLGGRSANAVLSLAYMALAARSLGVRDFGVLVLINTLAQFVGEVAKFQSWQTVLHFGAAPFAEGRRQDFQRVVRFSLVLDAASSVVGVFIGIGVALLASTHVGLPPGWGTTAAVYALTIAVMAPATPVGLLRLFDRFRVMSAQQAVGSAVRVIGSLPAFWLHAPIWVFLLIWAAGFAVSFAYMFIAAWTEMDRRGLIKGFKWRGPLTAGMPGAWRFAWATNFSSSVEVAFTHVATLAVGAGLGVADAALWRVARQVADGLAKPARLLVPALYPELARLRATEGVQAMARLAGRIGLIGGGMATLLLAVVLFAGGPLLGLVMGPGFTHAAGTMSWQVAAAVIGVWALPLEPMLVSLGRPGAALRVRIAVAIVFLACLRPAIAAFGLTGAGAALVASTVAMALGMLFELRRASAQIAS